MKTFKLNKLWRFSFVHIHFDGGYPNTNIYVIFVIDKQNQCNKRISNNNEIE